MKPFIIQRAHLCILMKLYESECNSISFTLTANTVDHHFPTNFITHPSKQNSLLPLQNIPALLLSCPVPPVPCRGSFFEHTTQLLPFLTGLTCCQHNTPIFLDAFPFPNCCPALLSITKCLSFSRVFCLCSSPEIHL